MHNPVEEVWVPIKGYPLYEVSNFGRIVNVETGRDRKPNPTPKGYLHLILFCEGVRRSFYVHRLVAEAFFLNYEDGVEVNHENGDLTDNSVLNLTLGDRRCRKPHA